MSDRYDPHISRDSCFSPDCEDWRGPWDELEAECDRLRTDYAAVKAAHDANAKMHGQATAYYKAMKDAEAERDRLFDEKQQMEQELLPEIARLRESRDEWKARAISGAYGRYEDENKRLRAMITKQADTIRDLKMGNF